MRGRWRDAVLALAALLAAVGLVRSVLVLRTPAAADLPEPMRRAVPRLADHQGRLLAVQPAWQGRDLALGPRYRYRLRPLAGGVPLQLELVVRRSRHWENLMPETLTARRQLRLGPQQQVTLGRSGGVPALQTCLVGRGPGELQPVAAMEGDELVRAVRRWQKRLDWPASKPGQLARAVAIQAGLRVSERWECLQVTLLLMPGQVAANRSAEDAALVASWRELYPQLGSWGEQWAGVDY